LIGLCSWGEKAHRKINSSCTEYFPEEIKYLKAWEPVLAAHGSDPDFRKKDDKTEFVRHFIDIDNYEDFNKNHRIETDFEKACLKYGRAKVIKEGTLPWTTDSVYKALVNDFKSKNWKQAAMTAAFLGHYVGDGHMPLHVTANYDGESTGQKGIHRRYEETMIDRYIDQIQFRKGNCKPVKEIKSFVFAYLYKNNSNVNLLLQADKDALKTAGGQYNDSYYSGLWDRTREITLSLLEESSKTLARLIYSAWKEAGKPMIPKLQAGIDF
jgi:hypothetical protein